MSENYDQDKLAQDLQNSSIGGNDQQQLNQYKPGNAQAFVPQGGYQQFDQYQQQQNYYNQQQNYNQGGYQQYQQQPQQYQNYNNNNRGGYNQRGGYQNTRGGYNNYNNRGGYQNYNNYNNSRGGYQGYNANNYNNNRGYNQYDNVDVDASGAPAAQGMSLADFQKQKDAQASSLNKPAVKKTLKLAPSSGIKLGNATIKVGAKKDDVSKESSPAPTSSATTASSASKESTPVAETKEEVTTNKTETKKTEEVKKTEVVKKESTPVASTGSVSARESTPISTASSVAKEQEDDVDEEVVKDLFGGKDHVSIIFMGHVDAGKSTMGGNILYLTGSVDKRTVEKYEREAKDAGRQGWYLSWVMDTNKEERNDGKTIEVGKAYFETEKRRYTILDAPGHKMYVSEMIGGASQADVGILVISARKGEYETGFEKGGQTREHALLAKTQGVNKIIVVVNKMDDPTVGWAEERYNECITKLGVFLKGIGYAKEDIVFMPVSGYTGAGLKDRVNPKDCPWYTGPALLEYLDNMETVNRKINGPFMLPISGKMKDMGTVVEGKIESGHIKKGGSLLLMPNKVNVEVLTVYNETEQECETAYSGEQVRLRLRGVEEEDLQPGYVLTSPKNPVKTVTRFEAQIAIVELKSILSNGFSCVMHLHAAIEEVKFIQLKHKLEKGTNRKSKKPPAFAKKGMKIIAVLEVAEPVCAETYNDYQQLGRFTLRDQGTTIAIGKITKLL